MEIKVVISSLGLGLMGDGLSVNVLTGAYIQVRAAPNSRVFTYGLVKSLSWGAHSGTLFVGSVGTEWFRVKNNVRLMHNTMRDCVNKKVQLEVKGALLIRGKADVKLTVYDSSGVGSIVFDVIDIPSRGGQLALTKVRGVLKAFPPKLTKQ